jgi:hypothetical protein
MLTITIIQAGKGYFTILLYRYKHKKRRILIIAIKNFMKRYNKYDKMVKLFLYCIRQSLFFLMSCIILTACKKENAITTGHLELSMLDSVNKLRVSGCTCGTDFMPPAKKLIWNNNLATAAQGHALDMYNNNYFDHISPAGTSPIQRAIVAGYTGQYVGENIAKGYTTIGQVMQAWKKSDDHCKAMMDTLYVEMGAYSYNGYWVQEFGR